MSIRESVRPARASASRFALAWCLCTAPACSSSVNAATSAPLPGPIGISGAFSLSASSAELRDPTARVQYVLTIANTGATVDTVTSGACWGNLRLYVDSARATAPAFDSGSLAVACPLFLRVQPLGPGNTLSLTGSAFVTDMVAAGLMPGRYYAALVVIPNGTMTIVPAGQVTIAP